MDDFALYADTPAMDDPDFQVSTPHRLIQVFLDDNRNFARLERVEVDGIADRNLMHRYSIIASCL